MKTDRERRTMLNEARRAQKGWSVIGNDGNEMGTVIEVHEGHLVVEGGTLIKHNLYVPVSAVAQAADERVMVTAPAADADKLGWRYPPERGYTRQGDIEPDEAAQDDITTMTGAAYGAGAGVSSAGPFAPGHGDAIDDRLGGSGRAGLSGLTSRPDDDLEPVVEDDAADTGDDTSDDTSDGTSDDTSTTGDAAEAPPLT